MNPELGPEAIVEATFVNAAALANSMAESRKQAVDARFEAAKPGPVLLTKGDLAVLQARNSVAEVLCTPCLESNGTGTVREEGSSRTRSHMAKVKAKAKARVEVRDTSVSLPLAQRRTSPDRHDPDAREALPLPRRVG